MTREDQYEVRTQPGKDTSMPSRTRFQTFPMRSVSGSISTALRFAVLIGLLSGTGAGCSKEPGSTNGATDSAQSERDATTQTRSDDSTESSFAEPPRNVRVLTLERGELEEFLVLSGALRPVRGADISAEESGVVAQILRDKGSYVKRGESILALDRRILEAEKRSAEANETLNDFNEERTEALFEDNSVSGQERLLVHTQAAQASAQADIARARFEKTNFPAPFGGIVSDRFVEVGELVAPGTRVARIIDPYQLELVGSITEREVAFVNQGAAVEIALEGLGRRVNGEVSWVGFEADPQNGKFPVEITIDNRSLDLRPGLLGRARIEKQAHSEVIAVPREAVLATNDGSSVFVADGEHARRRKVVLGVDQGTLVEVRSGLEAGDQLIVRGHRDLADGTPIRIQERATRRDGSIESDPNVVHDGAKPEPLGREISGGTR